MKKTRRWVGDPLIWELIHWLTMTFLGHRIVRGYTIDENGQPIGWPIQIYWDRASNWTGEGDDWVRKDVPYPRPIWRTRR